MLLNTQIKIYFIALTVVLSACSGGSGSSDSQRADVASTNNQEATFVYQGAAPADAEIQAFRVEFFDNLVTNDRCGSCHSVDGIGGLDFVNQEDVNDAWRHASTVVNLDDPGASAIVAQVASGHECWRGAASAQSCAQLIETWIENWAAGAQTGVTTIQLTPRTYREPEATKIFPVTHAETDFSTGANNLHSLLTTYCSSCHSDTSSVRQGPFFASNDPQVAYDNAITKISLSDATNDLNSAQSRLVVRLRDESHNCWDDCQSNAQEILDAIVAIVDSIPEPLGLDPALLVSGAQFLNQDGIAVSVGGRYEDNIIAKWEFAEGSGPTTVDTSGVAPAIFLNLSGNYSWLGVGGIHFEGGRGQATTSDSEKVLDILTATGEYSIEAWVVPFNVVQEDASIIAYSGGGNIRNFMVSQSLYNYESYNRSSANNNDSGGEPILTTDNNDELVQAALQHVVVTFDPVEGRKIYVNGVDTGAVDGIGGGNLSGWNDSFAIVLGNDPSGSNPWSGDIRMAAIHSRALTPEQISQNFDVGVGQVFFMLFSVSELIDEEGVCHETNGLERTDYCYIAFEISQIDSYSYLFSNPFFISLNESSLPANVDIRGIRIGINGRIADRGQAFVNIDESITDSSYTPGGEPLSSVGTIVGIEGGPTQDAFFLAFEEFNGTTGVQTPSASYAFVYTPNGVEGADVGMKTFDEINRSLSDITTVPTSQLDATYQTIRRSLPAIADFQAYFASHQMAVTQLAIGYCDALVDNAGLRSAFFNDGSAFDINRNADVIPDEQWLSQVIYPLLERILTYDSTDAAHKITQEPDRNDNTIDPLDDTGPASELLLLINDENNLAPYSWNGSAYVSTPDNIRDGLARCNNATTGAIESCSVARTAEVVKAVCAATIGSASLMMK